MSDYLCKVRQKKVQELELKWALEAAQKKAAAIVALIAQQAQMDAYADAMLGQTGFNSPTQILGAGKPLFRTAGDYSGAQVGGPNWTEIAEGGVLFAALLLLVDIPLGIGAVALFPEVELTMLVTEAWSIPLLAGLVAVHVYAIDMIVKGIKGDE